MIRAYGSSTPCESSIGTGHIVATDFNPLDVGTGHIVAMDFNPLDVGTGHIVQWILIQNPNETLFLGKTKPRRGLLFVEHNRSRSPSSVGAA